MDLASLLLSNEAGCALICLTVIMKTETSDVGMGGDSVFSCGTYVRMRIHEKVPLTSVI
jgi:hypothetical protein